MFLGGNWSCSRLLLTKNVVVVVVVSVIVIIFNVFSISLHFHPCPDKLCTSERKGGFQWRGNALCKICAVTRRMYRGVLITGVYTGCSTERQGASSGLSCLAPSVLSLAEGEKRDRKGGGNRKGGKTAGERGK